MNSTTTQGVEVSVETYYQPDYSNPISGEFMFAYRITIENHNSFPVKLHRRHWHIFDSNGEFREVEGEGVVGVQPVLQPGDRYQYVSGCNLRTEMGRMSGTYQMENMDTKGFFDADIPAFEMVVPFKNN
ncbi:Co2+/Mg2+ efflux protein ApaG [Flavihumibacter stibioxidans]|uniref:Co2+/Mg2+ efflux protein ApaG n=1 Tax=Flavihumibacter stibioxidans TaxID=1834163 RepID=A0ABR7M8I8_9BACT|nr:Co2+/Mg2+ efflux protein ApaG [Flavihumibacter stibioxidans]MBC6490941.1 Co2+/Mg2+ efflux protein ApaG [Flavihumibacter stibioxidans]